MQNVKCSVSCSVCAQCSDDSASKEAEPGSVKCVGPGSGWKPDSWNTGETLMERECCTLMEH